MQLGIAAPTTAATATTAVGHVTSHLPEMVAPFFPSSFTVRHKLPHARSELPVLMKEPVAVGAAATTAVGVVVEEEGMKGLVATPCLTALY